jgi:hypothetical protein
MACRSRCASHQLSFLSVLWPLRFLTSCALAKYTWTLSSSTLNFGADHPRLPSVLESSRRLWAEVLPRLAYSNRGCHMSTWPVSFPGPNAHHSNIRPSFPARLRFYASVLHTFSLPGVASLPVMWISFLNSAKNFSRPPRKLFNTPHPL